jgi:hypothetical protein
LRVNKSQSRLRGHVPARLTETRNFSAIRGSIEVHIRIAAWIWSNC